MQRRGGKNKARMEGENEVYELAKLGLIVLQVCEELAHGEDVAFLVEGFREGGVGLEGKIVLMFCSYRESPYR